MNDPTGLVYADGVFHLFYQYNPLGNAWGNMSWGHATSPDLCNWTELDVAIRFDDTEQVFTGSVVIDHDNTSGLGDGRRPVLVAVYTSAGGDGIQAQSLAHSNDLGATWRRFSGNPVLSRQSPDFRDPKVFRYEGSGQPRWIMVAVEAGDRQVLIYSSDNLRDWAMESALGPFGQDDVVWECPDLFPLRVEEEGTSRWVLSFSTNHPDGSKEGSSMAYLVGDFDGHHFIPQSADLQTLDHGPDFYAGTTFFGLPDRRIMIAWMNNWKYAADIPTHPWRGAMSVPRQLSLRRLSGEIRLIQEPVTELVGHPGPSEPVFEGQVTAATPVEVGRGLSFAYVIDWLAQDNCPFGIDLFASPSGKVRLSYDRGSGQLILDRSGSGTIALEPSIASANVPLREGHLKVTVLGDAGLVEVFADQGAATMSGQAILGDNPAGCWLFASRSVNATVHTIPIGTSTQTPDQP